MLLLEKRTGPPNSWGFSPDTGWVWWGKAGKPVLAVDSVAVLLLWRGTGGGPKVLAHGEPQHVRDHRCAYVAQEVTRRTAQTGLDLHAFTDVLDEVIYLERSDWPVAVLNMVICNPLTIPAWMLAETCLTAVDDPDLQRATKAQPRGPQ